MCFLKMYAIKANNILLLNKSLLLVGLIFVLLPNVYGQFFKRSTLLEDDVGIHTEYVDKHNQTILKMFNLTEAQMNRIQASNAANDKNGSNQQRDTRYFDNIKEYRLKDIRNRLQSAFQVGNSEEGQERPLHEMAAYPMCGTESSESSWLNDDNVTIQFSDSLFGPKRDNLSLESAILRLYKVNPNSNNNNSNTHNEYSTEAETDVNAENTKHKSKRCSDPLLESQIRVTVSIVQQLRRNRRERKKRICNTIMMNTSKTGWVEIDIKRAIYIWENVERQQQQKMSTTVRQPSILVGWLMIEVHDEEERPLKPGSFFQPPKCDQADLAIPWNYYRPHATLPTLAEKEVPRYPRLDVKLMGYASFAPRNYNKQIQQQIRDNIMKQLYNISKKPTDLANSDLTTTTSTPTAENLLDTSASAETLQLAQHTHRKRHIHRQRTDARNSHHMHHHHNGNSAYSHRHHREHRHQQHHHTTNTEQNDAPATYGTFKELSY